MLARRSFLKSASALAAASTFPSRGIAQLASATLPSWQPGFLEIHHIHTGRGNATLLLAPDGTSQLIDAGEAHSALSTLSPARPNTSRSAGEWIARYVQRQLIRVGRSDLDLMLLTHLHGDHVGEAVPSSPRSTRGNYRLTGAATVAESIPIRQIIDRGWPNYTYPTQPQDPSALNYIELAKSMASSGTSIHRAQAGSLTQLTLRRKPAL